MYTADRAFADVESDADHPASRSSDLPLRYPIRGLVRVFLCLAPACAVLPLALFAFGRDAGRFGAIFGGIFALVMLFSAGVTAVVGRSITRRLKRFQAGDYLVHWTYTKDEWRKFAEAEWARRRRDARQAPLAGLLIGGLTGLIFGVAVSSARIPGAVTIVLGALAGGVAAGLLGALLGWLVGWTVRAAGWRRYEQMQRHIGETYIGRDAAYCDGQYWNWAMYGVRLVRVELAPGRPTMLDFTLRVYSGKSGYTTYDYRALVPHGREGEARRVVSAIGGY